LSFRPSDGLQIILWDIITPSPAITAMKMLSRVEIPTQSDPVVLL